MNVDAQSHNTAAIHSLLVAAFDARELRRFCRDRESFKEVLTRFGPGFSLDDMADEVIEFCDKRCLFDELLTEVKQFNPRQYARFEPTLFVPRCPSTHTPPSPKLASVRSRVTLRAWHVGVLAGALVLVLIVGWGILQVVLPEPIPSPATTMSVAASSASPTKPTSNPTSIAPPCTGIGARWTHAGLEMVCVPAGEFLMGEVPDTVHLEAFWIAETEVTNAQYQECERARACGQRLCSRDDNVCLGIKCENLNAPDQPVVCVNWDDAQDYAAWVGGRLPTEEEWEKACRGTDGRTFPWGDVFDCHRGNFGDPDSGSIPKEDGSYSCDGHIWASPVGSFPYGASPYGVLDMVGNAAEWVAEKETRGGSMYKGALNANCTYSISYSGINTPSFRSKHNGFRVVMDPGPSSP